MSLTLDIECLCLLEKLMHSLIVGTTPHTSNKPHKNYKGRVREGSKKEEHNELLSRNKRGVIKIKG